MQLTADQAARYGRFVTVETDDAQVFVGTLSALPDGRFTVLSGRAGRPARLDPMNIAEVLTVDALNPHIDRS